MPKDNQGLIGNNVNLPYSVYRNQNTEGKAPAVGVVIDESSAITITTDANGITASGQIGAVIANAFTRPANTTAYTANQVINNATSGATQQTLTNVAKSNGASGYIRFVLAVGNSTPTPRIRVHVYNTAPTTVKNDAATWALDYANDASKYLGYIDLDALLGGVATSSSFFMYKCAANSRNLFYELQTLDAFTPANGTGYRLTAIPDQNNV